jgi:acetyl-CoA acetyltransferase
MPNQVLKDAFERARIVGAAVSDYPETPNLSTLDHHLLGITKALDDAGLQLTDVDGLIIAAGGGMGGLSPMGLAEYLGIRPTFVDGLSVGGSSYVYHAARAALAVGTGLCEVAVVATGQKGKTGGRPGRGIRGAPAQRSGGVGRGQAQRSGAPGGPPPQGSGSFFWDSLAGLPLIGAYAMAATRHMHTYGTTSEDLAEIAVAARYHATMNPKAQFQEPITVDDVLNSRWIAEPLHLLDCCVVSDGGGAYVVTTADRAKDLKKAPVKMLGYGERVGHAGIGTMPDFTQTAAADTGKMAFEMAGLKPGDIDCAELYDSFTITVALLLEDLGFCEKGDVGRFAREHLRVGGPLPINTDGGGLSAVHPGMRGMFLMTEAVRQVRGEPIAGGPGAVAREGGVDTCLVHGVGGQLSSHATLIVGKDDS